MKTLSNYLYGASHFLFPRETESGRLLQCERFKAYCEEHGLDKKFQELVKNDDCWRELAEEHPVCFFEDSVKDPDNYTEELPSISIFICNGENLPVIKLLLKHRTDFINA